MDLRLLWRASSGALLVALVGLVFTVVAFFAAHRLGALDSAPQRWIFAFFAGSAWGSLGFVLARFLSVRIPALATKELNAAGIRGSARGTLPLLRLHARYFRADVEVLEIFSTLLDDSGLDLYRLGELSDSLAAAEALAAPSGRSR